ncbi:MAG: Holliday junction resolvase RuvX [Cytophagales bacterium]|nr:Holliday junction resolvase RuvX [Cytophagales bacterium]
MARILAIDFGLKRVGIAATDPLQIIANALDTVETAKLIPYLIQYIKREPVETIVVGVPIDLWGNDTHATESVKKCIELLKKTFVDIKIDTIDERYTTKMAQSTLIAAGVSKKYRRHKGNLDKVSATIILQDYLLWKK